MKAQRQELLAQNYISVKKYLKAKKSQNSCTEINY